MNMETQYVVVSTRQFLGIQFYHYEGQQGTVHFSLGSKIIFGVFVKDLSTIKSTTAVVFEFLKPIDKENKSKAMLKDSLKLHSVPTDLTGYLSMEEKKGNKHRSHLFLVKSYPPSNLKYYGTINIKDILDNCLDCFLVYQTCRPVIKQVFTKPPSPSKSLSSQSSDSDNQQGKKGKKKEKKEKPKDKKKQNLEEIQQNQQKKTDKQQIVIQKPGRASMTFIINEPRPYKTPVIQILADFRITSIPFVRKHQSEKND